MGWGTLEREVPYKTASAAAGAAVVGAQFRGWSRSRQTSTSLLTARATEARERGLPGRASILTPTKDAFVWKGSD